MKLLLGAVRFTHRLSNHFSKNPSVAHHYSGGFLRYRRANSTNPFLRLLLALGASVSVSKQLAMKIASLSAFYAFFGRAKFGEG